jgi:glycosyltransferase involved in cell wall biosynthesis
MSNRLRILHVINGLGDGGAESVLYRLCQGDRQCEHVVVSLLGEEKYAPLLRAAGVTVHTLDLRPGGLRLAPLGRLWRILREHEPDVVQTWMYHADLVGGMLARISLRSRVCWNLRHAELDPANASRSSLWSGRLCAWLSRLVPQAIVCCGTRAAQVHAAMGYDPSRMHVIPNGYDLDHFRPDPAARDRVRHELGVAAGQPLVGMVANFKPDKDHQTLAAALERVTRSQPAVAFALAGRGITDDNPELRTLLDRHGLGRRVRLLGPYADVPALMNALDLHLLSSRSEGFPNVLAEAMACGTPCIATDAGEAAQIVGDTGWIVSVGDPDALARAIEQALAVQANGATWRERQQAVRHRVEQEYSLATMQAAYRQLWRGLAEGPSR